MREESCAEAGGSPVRSVTRRLGSLLAATAAVLAGATVTAPAAVAAPCPDAEVVFARGTGEPPGPGGVGQAFIDALRAKASGKSVSDYAVNYQASADFNDGIQFALTVVDGIRDATNHIQAVAADCPATKMVLGGFSQGAAVAAFSTSAEIPAGVPAAFVPAPMAPEISDHVAAVVLFGKPSNQFLSDAGAPLITIGPLYVPKTIDLCAPGDTICDGAPPGPPTGAHTAYVADGLVNQAAEFAASRL
ncbi:cutinase [Mycolicibacterium canariasense]|uniref:Cutinase n=1 Tax=Mycolicibacterium canariasense TaxID=228230 RepID=A0A100WHY2_MYCCR|nr:cutinase family protein [Mycolicibacterium canariasense]MCV7211705.1 cutinase family protein [Mycolicibacterium canariasense]ORV08212.1 cutinase [Mycolicibacterium canariasense]GAS98229.1 cutinase [Mycolicibacterium canariasense]